MACFYCEYSQASDAQSPEAILASLSYQLILQLDHIPSEVDSIYQRHRRQNTRPDLSEHVEILKHISTKFSKVWLLVDALDELDPGCRDDLTETIETLMTFTKVLVTSRPQAIASKNLENKTLRCIISARSEELRVFVENRLAKASPGLRESPGWNALVSDTKEKLVALADGMFILVSLQMDVLLKMRTVIEMRRALETISNKVDDFYKSILDRIRAGQSDTPLKILAWLVKSPRPITARALREALAVEYSTTSINPDALVSEGDMVPMCCGLVLTHKKAPLYHDDLASIRNHSFDDSEELSLAHATVHEYLSKNLEIVQGFDRVITKACMRYISFVRLSSPYFNLDEMDSRRFDDVVDDVVNKHPFLDYAARYLSYNSESQSEEPEELPTHTFSQWFTIARDFSNIKRLEEKQNSIIESSNILVDDVKKSRYQDESDV